MIREQKLINKILSDGKRQSSSIVKNAEKEANEMLQKAKQEESEFVKEQLKIEKQKNKQQLEFSQSLNNLEKNKVVLKAKTQIIDDVFSLVLQKLQNLKATEYTKFLSDVLKKANKGDGLIISKRKGEEEKFKKLAIFKEKKLSIEKTTDKFSGGVIIVGKVYDLDFSFESLVKQKYENSISKVAKLLF